MASSAYLSCIEACHACASTCLHCATSCLNEPDPKSMTRCIQLDLDCAAICRLAIEAMSRDSENAPAICTLCADICDACGDECSRHPMDHCQACAQACRQCAQACRGMSPRGARPGATSGAGAMQH